ncbi:MAG: CapA family protein [Ardenticatenaceae bacterium]|nr:CapA family protein [Ardenticatenaceae bacterium]
MKAEKRGLILLPLLLILFAAACARQVETSGLLPQPDLSAYPWVYLRDGQPLADDESVVELIAVGDVMLGRDVANEPEPLADVVPWLTAADLTFGNLEAAIVEDGTPRTAPAGEPQPIILAAPVTAVPHLTSAGFDILSLANNHSLDFGPDGLAETAVRLQDANIDVVGAGPDTASAYQPLIREVDGLRLAFLAFNAVPDPANSKQLSVNGNQWQPADWDEVRATEAVAQAQEQADVVVVSMHWGYEYEQQVDPWQETAVQALTAAGANLILGHHPHVVQETSNLLGLSNQRLPNLQVFTAYSLGNFVFDQGQDGTDQGLALRVFFDKQGLRAVQVLPVWAGPHPRLMTPEEAAPLLARIQPPPPRISFACEGDDCHLVNEAGFDTLGQQGDASGIFWSGAIDLTGDGADEIIRRAGERVTIYQEGTAVYTTPPEWYVVDAALGDPNDDGRYELLLAIWQTDNEGHDRSQPYIVGYRGGEYKLIWGGRPLARPISEIELGDVDGDGKQELVSVEEDAISVWRWQGWNFSLMWRSENGRYQGLVLQKNEQGYETITITTP